MGHRREVGPDGSTARSSADVRTMNLRPATPGRGSARFSTLTGPAQPGTPTSGSPCEAPMRRRRRSQCVAQATPSRLGEPRQADRRLQHRGGSLGRSGAALMAQTNDPFRRAEADRQWDPAFRRPRQPAIPRYPPATWSGLDEASAGEEVVDENVARSDNGPAPRSRSPVQGRAQPIATT